MLLYWCLRGTLQGDSDAETGSFQGMKALSSEPYQIVQRMFDIEYPLVRKCFLEHSIFQEEKLSSATRSVRVVKRESNRVWYELKPSWQFIHARILVKGVAKMSGPHYHVVDAQELYQKHVLVAYQASVDSLEPEAGQTRWRVTHFHMPLTKEREMEWATELPRAKRVNEEKATRAERVLRDWVAKHPLGSVFIAAPDK